MVVDGPVHLKGQVEKTDTTDNTDTNHVSVLSVWYMCKVENTDTTDNDNVSYLQGWWHCFIVLLTKKYCFSLLLSVFYHVSVFQYSVFEFGTGVKSKTLTPLTIIMFLIYKVGGTVSSFYWPKNTVFRHLWKFSIMSVFFSTVFSNLVQVSSQKHSTPLTIIMCLIYKVGGTVSSFNRQKNEDFCQ